jgi:hypothetical protein
VDLALGSTRVRRRGSVDQARRLPSPRSTIRRLGGHRPAATTSRKLLVVIGQYARAGRSRSRSRAPADRHPRVLERDLQPVPLGESSATTSPPRASTQPSAGTLRQRLAVDPDPQPLRLTVARAGGGPPKSQWLCCVGRSADGLSGGGGRFRQPMRGGRRRDGVGVVVVARSRCRSASPQVLDETCARLRSSGQIGAA